MDMRGLMGGGRRDDKQGCKNEIRLCCCFQYCPACDWVISGLLRQGCASRGGEEEWHEAVCAGDRGASRSERCAGGVEEHWERRGLCDGDHSVADHRPDNEDPLSGRAGGTCRGTVFHDA